MWNHYIELICMDKKDESVSESVIWSNMDNILRLGNAGRNLEERVIALERALEALLKKEEMSKLNLSGGDGEWY